MIKITGNIGKLSLAGQFQKVLQAIIKFMIAGNRDIIAGSVHDLYNRFAPGQKADWFTLNGIAIIYLIPFSFTINGRLLQPL